MDKNFFDHGTTIVYRGSKPIRLQQQRSYKQELTEDLEFHRKLRKDGWRFVQGWQDHTGQAWDLYTRSIPLSEVKK